MTSPALCHRLALLLYISVVPLAANADETNPPRALFAMQADGTGVHRVARIAGVEWLGAPSVSHDGTRVVFDARNPKPDDNSLFVIGLDGTALGRIGPGGHADWSGDDQQLAFDRGANIALKSGIWVQNADGRGRQWLCEGERPRWSPDGSRLALVDKASLLVLDLADSSQRSLLAPGDKIKSVLPGFAWSPDGSRLAACVERAGGFEIVLVGADGSDQGLQTRCEGKAEGIAWNPDGKTLVVALWNETEKLHRLHLLDVGTGDPPLEIPGQQGDNREPGWTPDGKQIIFASSRDAGLPQTPVPVATGDVQLKQTGFYDAGGTCYSLALMPDGRAALLGCNAGRNRRMTLWDFQNSALERQIDIRGIVVAVAPDGQLGACAS